MTTLPNIREQTRKTLPGIPLLLLFLALLLGTIGSLIFHGQAGRLGPLLVLAHIAVFLSIVVAVFGLFIVHPNQSKALQLFGDYRGSVLEAGLHWANPFFSKKAISVRVRNFETGKLKVNDAHGNPIEIATVVVWKVVDTAEALFNVDDFKDFVEVQSEAALRTLATGYPYDAHEEGESSLSSHTGNISGELRTEIQNRLERAGVEVIEARISHLAYSPEIAAAMLQRQQASAIVAARQQIVEGAVGMVETALEMLSRKGIIELDDERKAAMVSNLLVVLCGDHNAQPVVNAGSLYN